LTALSDLKIGKVEAGHATLQIIAKWEHIVKLYKRDKHSMIHMLYKLTDTHLSSVTQCGMKVNLAAQVMSHTVAAVIYTVVSHGREHCLHSLS